MLTPLGITYRRALLDTQLTKLAAATLGGRVLDVGGRRQVRGRFRPPAGVAWIQGDKSPLYFRQLGDFPCVLRRHPFLAPWVFR